MHNYYKELCYTMDTGRLLCLFILSLFPYFPQVISLHVNNLNRMFSQNIDCYQWNVCQNQTYFSKCAWNSVQYITNSVHVLLILMWLTVTTSADKRCWSLLHCMVMKSTYEVLHCNLWNFGAKIFHTRSNRWNLNTPNIFYNE